MATLSTLTLLISGVTIALSLSFLLITLWNDARKEQTQFFAVFLLLVIMWNLGSLLGQTLILIDPDHPLLLAAASIMELGFTGSSIAVYTLTAALTKLHTWRTRILAFVSLGLVFTYRFVLLLGGAPSGFAPSEEGIFAYQAQPILIFFYLIFDGATLYLLWRYRSKIRARALWFGLLIFVVGQSLGFLNPELQAFALSINIASIAVLIISFGLLREEIIRPLAERNSQVEAIRKVSVSIATQSAIHLVLEQIAAQTVQLLGADAAAIFLRREGSSNEIELVTAHNLPAEFLGERLQLGQGMAGAAVSGNSIVQVNDYSRDWRGQPDMPLARETFGSALCAPLVHGDEVIGALLIIAARHGRIFDREDTYLLQLLGAQASVAIAHSRLFAEQTQLTQQVEYARSQLETVLMSTESPVLALDRSFRLKFANSAARALFAEGIAPLIEMRPIFELFPRTMFPPSVYAVMREIRRSRGYTYEVALDGRTFMCHLATYGDKRTAGWVAVLHDVTQLKELDRMKSEMVRMTSHDLKNPLQAAMANLELLRDDVYSSGSREVQVSLDSIDKQLQRMNRIISGILDMERLRSGTTRSDICPAKRIASDAVDEMRDLARESGVEITLRSEAADAQIACDREQLQRAIINLVENAVKFSPRGSEVVVSVRLSGGNVLYAVEDHGVGIEKSLHGRVFERFFRGKQPGVEHVTGTGLGLSLVKTIVENHRGRVWLDSEPGRGTSVYVSIPVHVGHSEVSSVSYSQ
ncbi:GAF domain-containing protein [Anaerolineae bacterium CFX9]|nr:GAF domain-containing protein [Anaerolineae bacterium CFX9]